MYVFRPKGVCPSEIHFNLHGDRIGDLRMIGGGCPGNSQLVARLLEGRTVEETMPFLDGIICRNGTSCADQLAQALLMVKTGRLEPADPITVGVEEIGELRKMAVVAEVEGDIEGLGAVCAHARAEGAQVVYSLGNLVGCGRGDAAVELAAREGIRGVQGPTDRLVALGASSSPSDMDDQTLRIVQPRNKDRLLLNPLIRSFYLGDRHGVAFYSGFIQELSGFSDFSPYSTEILMVSNLSDYLCDESVFTALEAMTEHFTASIVLFGHTQKWKHTRLGGVDFINIGALRSSDHYRYALLEWKEGTVEVRFETVPIQDSRKGAGGE